MKHYLVNWEIDIFADSPQAAAEQALEIQRRVGSQAVVFDVHCGEEVTRVDLNEPDSVEY